MKSGPENLLKFKVVQSSYRIWLFQEEYSYLNGCNYGSFSDVRPMRLSHMVMLMHASS